MHEACLTQQLFMDKYTLKTVFQKSFSGLVWRIEVDTVNRLMAVETRNTDTGTPRFSTLRYTTGESLVDELAYGDRNWTLAGASHGNLVLRAYGQHGPESAGVASIDATTGKILWEQFNYNLLELREGVLRVRHRNFASGHEQYLSIADGELTPVPNLLVVDQTDQHIIIPKPHIGERPGFLSNYAIHGELFHCAPKQVQVWGFHEKKDETYSIRLVVSNDLGIVTDKVGITGLTKMIPELFFMINDQLFLIGDNKQKIVSYLV